MNVTNIRNLILILASLLIAALCIILPGMILKSNDSKNFNSINAVPAEYYSGPSETVIKNASKQLTDEQCLQLITGQWGSNISPAKPEECNLTEYEAKNLATLRMNNLLNSNLYPFILTSTFNQWYSWEATPYRVIDSTFRTYATCFWDITYIKYDHSETHRVIMTETGIILYVNAKAEDENFLQNFSPSAENYGCLLIEDDNSLRYLRSKYEGTAIITLTEDKLGPYTITEVPDKEKYQFNITKTQNYIPDLGSLTPDHTYNLTYTSEGGNESTYKIMYKKTDNEYSILLQP